jgi:hypothetical protein
MLRMYHKPIRFRRNSVWKPTAASAKTLMNRKQNRDSSVGIALGYGLDGRGSRVRFPAGAGNFSLHHRVQNGSGAPPTSYPRGTGGSFPGGKAAGAWTWPLTYIYTQSYKALSYNFTSPYGFMTTSYLSVLLGMRNLFSPFSIIRNIRMHSVRTSFSYLLQQI